ncbi:putative RNA methyltransferase [Plasmodium gaboni]|uniref:16S rRNA (uracil(1498)-N(3))-methyltransferase n=1 Tax=Plasmodium gaboni TaxID=647221 RepID=A0A151LRX3_9APIC|nr:putative RNA methyltransferase [Plasmodium gaboni]KYO01917.1 putative RNA methyltransferase [Plasmodium gaboni]
MNLILISSKIIYKNNEEYFFKTDSRQTSHLKNILNVTLNQIIKVGVINKGKGEGIIVEENKSYYIIKLLTPIHLEEKSDDNILPIDVVICIPRPKVLNKLLQQLSSLGVKKIIIVFSDFSNKCYESSKVLKNEEIKLALQLGLEQAMCTRFPEIYIHYSFSSFFMNIEKYTDEHTLKICAHTNVEKKNTEAIEYSILNMDRGKILLMLGCERGFSELELYLIKKLNFHFFNLTERILKCETALLIIIGQLLLLTENISLRKSGTKMRRFSPHKKVIINNNICENITHMENNNDIKNNLGNDKIQCKIQLINEVKKLLTEETFSSEQLITFIKNTLHVQEKKHICSTTDNYLCLPDEKLDINDDVNIIDILLRDISSYNENEETNFEKIYLSLQLKKIKYKHRFYLSYGDIKNNVDDDGVYIYRTQRYISKKKN